MDTTKITRFIGGDWRDELGRIEDLDEILKNSIKSANNEEQKEYLESTEEKLEATFNKDN